MASSVTQIFVVEPFCGDSHNMLVHYLEKSFSSVTKFVLPPKKWHWKARTSALYFAQVIPFVTEVQNGLLFVSSVLNLAELIALRPDLAKFKKIIYFHENQLQYPVRKYQDRDFQYGYNQILSSLVADTVLFNSCYNLDSFLSAIPSFLNLIPDHKPKNIAEQIRPKCHVVYLPLPLGNLHEMAKMEQNKTKGSPDVVESAKSHEEKVLHIVWPHRWEHDKNPHLFFNTLLKLLEEGFHFHLSVLGGQFATVPEIFAEAKEKLSRQTLHWGYQHSKTAYYSILSDADVVVSTADHEFFGIAMIEASYLRCFPLCPSKLVYPEIFPKECLYNTPQQLFKRLREFCKKPWLPSNQLPSIDFSRFSEESRKVEFEKHFVQEDAVS